MLIKIYFPKYDIIKGSVSLSLTFKVFKKNIYELVSKIIENKILT